MGTWDAAKTTATQLTTISTEEFFDVIIRLDPEQFAQVQAIVDFVVGPTDHAVISVYAGLVGGELVGNPDLDFLTGGDRILRASGSWVDDGFVVGQEVLVTDSAADDGWYVVDSFSTTSTADDTMNMSASAPDLTPLSGNTGESGVTVLGSNWDGWPLVQFQIRNAPEPRYSTVLVQGVFMARVGVQRSATTDDLTSADLSFQVGDPLT